jgi:hypothetical protein
MMPEVHQLIFIYSVRSGLKTNSITVLKNILLYVFREIIAVSSEKYVKIINAPGREKV